MIRTQIQLEEKQAERLKAVAVSRGLSMAELVRRAVDAVILPGGFVDMEERRRRAIKAAGRFCSSVSDLSTDHDKYLFATLPGPTTSSRRKAGVKAGGGAPPTKETENS